MKGRPNVPARWLQPPLPQDHSDKDVTFDMNDMSLPYVRAFYARAKQLTAQQRLLVVCVRELGRAHTLKRYPVWVELDDTLEFTPALGDALQAQGYKVGYDEERRAMKIDIEA